MQQAPARKNKIDEITKGLYSEAEQRNQSKLKRKIIERSLMALAMVGTFAVVSLLVMLLIEYKMQQHPITCCMALGSNKMLLIMRQMNLC